MSDKYEIHFIDANRPWRWRPEEINGFLPHFLEWLVELASALQARGHGVIVYYNGVDTEYCSVRYRNCKEYDKKGQVQIYWGDVSAFRPGAQADVAAYFSNGYEVYSGGKVPSFRDIDFIVTKGKIHLEGLTEVIQKGSPTPEDGEKIVSIMPGLDRGQFGPVVTREPMHFLYASPWYHGLDRVLKIWPAITKVIKDANLSVCYGGGFTARMEGKKTHDVESQYAPGLKQKGIKVLGTVGRADFGALLRRVDLLLFPSAQPETFGASCYKAQFSGAIPITSDDDALAETVRDGGLSLAWKDYQATLLQVATSEAVKDIVRKKQKSIIFPTWDEVASAWEEEIRIRLEANKQNGNADEETSFS